MKSLAIVAYFDGQLGHEKQTRAILQALAQLTETDVISRKVPVSPTAYCKNWASYLMLPFRPKMTVKTSERADIIIGTGTHTHIPMLLEKYSRAKHSSIQVRVVTCMSPDALLRDSFDLCFVPLHDNPPPKRQNVFVTVGPPSPMALEKKHKPGRGLILVGGLDRKSHRWDTRTVIEQIQTLIHKNPTLNWTVSSSPRTPQDTCLELEGLAASKQQLIFFRSNETPVGWVEEQYALNATVWVTADSISMVYEALTAGCSVGILPVVWLKQKNKFQQSLDILHERKMIVDYNEWLTGAPMPVPSAEPFNEAARCAQEILKRWWPDRLQ